MGSEQRIKCECDDATLKRFGTRLEIGQIYCNHCEYVVKDAISPIAGNEVRPLRQNSDGESKKIAIQSARIVNAYGTYVQIVGIVIGVLIGLLGCWLASSAHNFVIAVGGFLLGSLDVAAFAVQGALFRMISNYVIARLDSE